MALLLQDVWHCEICNRKPGRGFGKHHFLFYINICINQSFILFLMLSFDLVLLFIETTVEVLPRLCQIKYASGTLEELLYIDMPRESQNPSGQIILDYTKAIQESVFEQLRVVREGHLRIVFNPDLKVM